MSAPIEATYFAHVDEITRLMLKKGFSLDSLAKAAPVSVATLKRLLQQGRPAYIATFRKIAEKLDVTPDVIIQSDQSSIEPQSEGPASTPKRGAANVVIDQSLQETDETDEVVNLLTALRQALGAKGKIYVLAIADGSVVITLEMDKDDIARLARAFADSRLEHLKVIDVTPAPGPDDAHIGATIEIAKSQVEAAKERVGEALPAAIDINVSCSICKTPDPQKTADDLERLAAEHNLTGHYSRYVNRRPGGPLEGEWNGSFTFTAQSVTDLRNWGQQVLSAFAGQPISMLILNRSVGSPISVDTSVEQDYVLLARALSIPLTP
jgi:transcriptional regulator with XRE-family HTH domain